MLLFCSAFCWDWHPLLFGKFKINPSVLLPTGQNGCIPSPGSETPWMGGGWPNLCLKKFPGWFPRFPRFLGVPDFGCQRNSVMASWWVRRRWPPTRSSRIAHSQAMGGPRRLSQQKASGGFGPFGQPPPTDQHGDGFLAFSVAKIG